MQKFRVFIGCIPGDAVDREIFDVLKSFAKVTSIKLARGRNSAGELYCLGYGYVNCTAQDDVERLVSLKQIMYRGRDLSLRNFKQGNTLKSEKKKFSNSRLFIGGITSWIKFDSLRPLFEKYGSLETFYQVDQSKNMKFKYGYAVFTSTEAATTALENLNGFTYKGCVMRVERFGPKDSGLKAGKSQTQHSASHTLAQTSSNSQELGIPFNEEKRIKKNNKKASEKKNGHAELRAQEIRFNMQPIGQSQAFYSQNISRVGFGIKNHQEFKLMDDGQGEMVTRTDSDLLTTGKGSYWVVPSRILDHSPTNIRMNAMPRGFRVPILA